MKLLVFLLALLVLHYLLDCLLLLLREVRRGDYLRQAEAREALRLLERPHWGQYLPLLPRVVLWLYVRVVRRGERPRLAM